MEKQRAYIAIDLKSFYASVECRERGLDPLSTNLVVADRARTEKTICLAVSPSLKAHGIPGRARLFEVVERVREVNRERLDRAVRENRAARDEKGRWTFSGASVDANALARDPSLELSYITATPRMAYYIQYSTRIYSVYLKYIAPEDIHVYSIDEVFIDATPYLETYRMTARELAKKLMGEVLEETGITAAAGVGSNLYLAKIAMDVGAKHVRSDGDGARIAELDELSYREKLWEHTPLTDFWRVGRGCARKLEQYGMYTMGDVARCSLGEPGAFHSEELLYRLFGVNAELLIDHAWGWEPCTIADIRAYRPETSSICSGQVLTCPYTAERARIVVREMADSLALELVEKGLATDQLTLTVGYDIENLTLPEIAGAYKGPITVDHYGRRVPRHAHGTHNFQRPTSSARELAGGLLDLFDRAVDPALLVRRLTVTANRLSAGTDESPEEPEQLDLFTDYVSRRQQREAEQAFREREHRLQRAVLEVKDRYGKNAILKGTSFQEGATAISRNGQIGGHRR